MLINPALNLWSYQWNYGRQKNFYPLHMNHLECVILVTRLILISYQNILIMNTTIWFLQGSWRRNHVNYNGLWSFVLTAIGWLSYIFCHPGSLLLTLFIFTYLFGWQNCLDQLKFVARISLQFCRERKTFN